MEKTKTTGKYITFCPKCRWYRIQDEDEDIRKCPKCNTWTWAIYQYKYFEGKKLVAKEAGLTDNDESYISGESLKELKRIFDKGLRLMEVSLLSYTPK
jgi:hypothetical protein